MDTTMWMILLAILIFADINIAYFEIRRLTQFPRNDRPHNEANSSNGGGDTAAKTDFKI